MHEFSHAFAAYIQGDSTSKYLGRLTLNPLAHIDWIGLFMLIFVGFGWGKPVPFNPYNLRNNRWGQAIVALFGPLANIVTGLIFVGVLRVIATFDLFPPTNLLVQFLLLLILINFILAVFNLIPIPPLDGSKILFSFLSSKYNDLIVFLETRGPFILIILILFDDLTGISIFSTLFSRVYDLIFWLVG